MRVDDNWGKAALKLLCNVNANVLIASLERRYSYEELKQFDFIASCTTGTDHINNRDIPLISLKNERDFLMDVHATAEHTWALILSLIRKVPFAFNDVLQGHWRRENFQGTELYGRVLGVIGYGRVGQQVAKTAEAFGMCVWSYDVEDARRVFFGAFQFADILTVHVPLAEDTRGMFGIEQFKQMKPTAYFINTSRGAVVRTADLLLALKDGVIAGAALDVLDTEPDILPEVLEYMRNNTNLIVTPHLGGNTAESREITQMFIARKILDFVNRGDQCELCKSGEI